MIVSIPKIIPQGKASDALVELMGVSFGRIAETAGCSRYSG